MAASGGVASGYPNYTGQPGTGGYQQAPSQAPQQYQQNTGYGMYGTVVILAGCDKFLIAPSTVGYQPTTAPSYGVDSTGYQAPGQQWGTSY